MITYRITMVSVVICVVLAVMVVPVWVESAKAPLWNPYSRKSCSTGATTVLV
jgi:hypothetical protein